MSSEARPPGGRAWHGPALPLAGFPWHGSAAPELAAGPLSHSHPTSLFLPAEAAAAPDSWGQPRQQLQTKVPAPRNKRRCPFPSSERARDGQGHTGKCDEDRSTSVTSPKGPRREGQEAPVWVQDPCPWPAAPGSAMASGLMLPPGSRRPGQGSLGWPAHTGMPGLCQPHTTDLLQLGWGVAGGYQVYSTQPHLARLPAELQPEPVLPRPRPGHCSPASFFVPLPLPPHFFLFSAPWVWCLPSSHWDPTATHRGLALGFSGRGS